jgi:UDP-2,3-diacylglucosamine hydrolase
MYYFASDVHLGLAYEQGDHTRERTFVAWLDSIKHDAKEIYLVGDIFDFWFEYGHVVPKGFTRTLGKIAELTDAGIKVHFFTGNHDMWVRNYFERECGMIVHYRGELIQHAGKTIMVAHGDNLSTEGKPMLKLMNALFRSNLARWLFRNLLHPDLSMRFGKWWSGKSRKSKAIKMEFRGEEEFLVQYAREWVDSGLPIDYYVFGHIHSAADYPLSERSRALFLGEWIEEPHYAVMDAEGNMKLIKL